MNLKEVTYLLGWTREKVEIAIVEGIRTPKTDRLTRLAAGKQANDYDRPVTRAEYDDGAAIIDGKPQQIPGAQLRVRYNTPYNFIIASQESPINNSQFDAQADKILNDILKGKSTVQEFANEMRKLPRRRYFDGAIL